MKTKKGAPKPSPDDAGVRESNPLPGSAPSPLIAIVIPLFKHSVLVADALESVIAQRSRFPFVVVVVNDGCPFHESDLQIKSIQAAHPDLLRYLVQRNKGLSAARNSGIDYALKRFPTVQAIYLLDADNTILPGAIDAAYSKLAAEPETSWIYPNIDMFGIKRNFDYSGPYSVLRHTQHNICEAGSMVHRRIFDAGVRFDEGMKLGYEDWDFWLTAAARGFRGAHLPSFGFRYRNRGESMLSQAQRLDKELQAYLQRKHTSLLSKRGLLRLESAEAPRFAIVFTDTNQVLLTSGSTDASEAILLSEFDKMLWRNIVVPSMQYLPPFFAFMARSTFELLSQLGLILWTLHDSEVALKEMNIASLLIDARPEQAIEILPGGRPGDSDVVALSRDLICAILRSMDTSWVERVVLPSEEMKVLTKILAVPRRAGLAIPEKGTAAISLLLRIRSWRASPYRTAGDRNWIWRELSVPPPHTLYFNVRAAFDGDVVYPSSSTQGKDIGFVVPIGRYGGVERVAYNLAQQFARRGWRVHLFVIGQTRVEIPPEFSRTMASINFLNDPHFGGWDPQGMYQGTALPAARNNRNAASRIVAAMAWLDVVINCHSAELNAAVAELRQLGVRTAAHLHILDMSPFDRCEGHPIVTLAYEYAYDLILCNSEQLMSWMHGAGTPREKLVLVRNAPGHPVSPGLRKEILAHRDKSARRTLHALYLGRLDRQKGIDRLAEVVRHASDHAMNVQWRLVGSNVTDNSPIPPILRGLLEPAVIDSQHLISLYSWADVMVLLSDYEGVPLSILEAQHLGVVVIATNVGALSEIIQSGRNGFLVERATAVEETLGLLNFLEEVPTFRSRIAANAARVIEWSETAKECIDRVSALVASRPDQA